MLGGGFDTLHPWCSTTAVSPRDTLALIDGSSNDNDEEDKTATARPTAGDDDIQCS